jgi:hypothetical protein
VIITFLGWLFIASVLCVALGIIATVIEIGYVVREIWRRR